MDSGEAAGKPSYEYMLNALYDGAHDAEYEYALRAELARLREVERFAYRACDRFERVKEMLLREGFVFETDLSRDGLNEAERWEKCAFSIYTRFVSAAEGLRAALEQGERET